MKKLTLLTALLVAMGGMSYAQKVKVTSGKLKDLSSFKSYNMEYSYSDGLKIGKMSETDYLEERRTAKNEKEAGSGDAWVEKWEGNKAGGGFFTKFETLFNEVLADAGVSASRDNGSADCTIKANVYYLDPGFNVGITRRPAYISMTVTFVKDGKEIAVVDMAKAPGQGAGGYDFDAAFRISEGFEKSGKTLGKVLMKQAYK